MLDYAAPRPGEATQRAVVTVIFLRMDAPPPLLPVVWPSGVALTRARLALGEYRALYEDIGASWLWWLRRVMPDELLAAHLAKPTLAIYQLRVDGRLAGFFETDAAHWPYVNLNYFGLLPQFIGRGLGKNLLHAAIDSVFNGASSLRGMTLNTCNADHPAALPNYLAAGFREVRRAREEWDIPVRLGFAIPAHLRG